MKKFLGLILSTAVLLTMIPASVFAVGLSDIGGHWGKASIEYLVGKGAISGYPDSTFKPNGTITKAEFLKIAFVSITGTYTRSNTGHWATGIFEDAINSGIVLESEMPASTWDNPISRYEMTRIMVRLTENVLKEAQTSTSGVANIMSDYSKVSSQQAYKYYVEQAFMKGLIAGKTSDGLFDGAASGTRAEASTMINRILEPSIRVKVNTNVTVAPAGTTVSLTNPSRTTMPKAGMTVVKADGTSVVLKVGPSGVLGEGQGVDYYSGITFENGYVFGEGDLGVPSMGDFASQPYKLDQYGEGHFRQEWIKIQQSELEKAKATVKNPTDGTKFGRWFEYVSAYNQWVWTGPVV